MTNLIASMIVAVAAQEATPQKDLVDTAIGAGSFKTLVAAVQAAKLVDTLKGPGPFTIFAPSDAAFAKLPAGTVENLLKPENQAQLASVLTYHVVPGKWMAKDVVGLSGALTVQGQRIDFKVTEGSVSVDGAKVVQTDIACKNGVIHVIDAVLLPARDDLVATAAAAGSFKTLLAAAKAAGLAETLAKDGPFTIFAPTDAAFAKLPAGTVESLLKPENKEKLATILKLHVVKGRVYAVGAIGAGKATTLANLPVAIVKAEDGSVTVNGARILHTDLDASNGVIHVIDTVLLPAK